MWSLFGDRTPGPPGSHYWRSSVLHNPFWGILDQVLVRPAIMERLVDLRILETDGQHSFLAADGTPDKEHMSDHLPVLFRLNI